MASKQYKRFVHFVIFTLALVLLFKVVEPIITIFLSSILITYISYPIYKRLRRHLPSEFISIVLTLIIVTLIMLLPFSYLIYKVTQQTYEFYNENSENIAKGNLFGFKCKAMDSQPCYVINSFEKFSSQTLSKLGLDKYLQSVLTKMLNTLANYLLKLPQALLGTGLSLFLAYFLFRDWHIILNKIIHWLPFRQSTSKKLVSKFEKITYSIVFSQILVAIIQGIIGIFGFWVFGAPFPLFLGVIMAFFALFPTFGTAFVWAPVSIFMFSLGYFSNDHAMMWKSAALFAYGMFIISTVDNILRVYFIQAKAHVHPIIVIAGLIGGINLFGIIGLFLGPITVSLLLSYFESFRERFL